MSIKSFFFVMLIATTENLYAQVDSTFDIYLLVGQSNMAGRGEVTATYTYSDERVLMLSKDGEWVAAKHPLHFDKPAIAGVGPGLQFGVAMANGSKGHKIGLIPCAIGGTSIDKWVPGGYDSATKTHPYDDAVKRLEMGLKSGVIRGIIWHQGEADSSPEKAKNYLSKLETLIRRFRELTGDPNLPFVAGELGRYKEQYANINAELMKLPAAVPHTAVAGSEGFTDKGDQTHFDSPSAEEFGKRFAAEMIRLQRMK